MQQIESPHSIPVINPNAAGLLAFPVPHATSARIHRGSSLQGTENSPRRSENIALATPTLHLDLAARRPNPDIDSIICKKDAPISSSEFRKLKNILAATLEIPINRGIVAASNGNTHQSAWVRDMSAVSNSLRETREDKLAASILKALYTAYNSNAERSKINGLNGSEAQQKWAPADGNAGATVPLTKFGVNSALELGALDHPWGHQQLDAFGYFLQELSTLAKSEKLDLKKLDNEVRMGKDHEHAESTLVAMVRMLKNINYHNNYDLGAWESHWQTGRLSSIAAVVSGLVSVQEYMHKRSSEEIPQVNNPNIGLTRERFEHELQEAILQGKAEIQRRLEEEIIHEVPHIEGVQTGRAADIALLFLLSLSDPQKIGITEKQESKILKSVYSLMGELGFRRFSDDNYMSRDWHNRPHSYDNFNGEFGRLESPHDAAEWCMFDPYLATVNYKMFLKSLNKPGEPDWDAFKRADVHTRRALAHVTSDYFSFERNEFRHQADGSVQTKKIQNTIPPMHVLESYFRISDKDGSHRYMPGENLDLNWTKAAMRQMLEIGEQAAAEFGKVDKAYNRVYASMSQTQAKRHPERTLH